jgi:TonB family protein
MKPLNPSQVELTRPRFLSLFALASLMLSLTVFSQIGQAQQQAQLSLADVLIGLRSKKVTLDERNKLLAGAVSERGVTFSLTPEIETELVSTGANRELVEAIRQKSEKITVAVASKPSSAPPSIVAAEPAPDYIFYRKRADENNLKGEYELAVGDYNKAIELNPADSGAYYNRGRANSGRKSYDLAILDYNKTIELDPKDSNAYLDRGDIYEKKGNLQQAVSDYEKAVEFDAKNERAKNNLKRVRDEQAKTLTKPKTQETSVISELPNIPESPKVTESSVTPKTVELGLLNSFALKLATPVYPEIAQKLNAQGKVTVQITIDEEGKVIFAKATSGSSLLRSPSEDAARKSKFRPTFVGSRPVKATGYITYNFVDKM